MQLLPIGRQNLERLRFFDCLYIDKTMYAEQIMQYGGSFFLSRPRRFGKSLFLSTLMELAKGNRALFANTHVDKTWNWERKYPVIHLSFAKMPFQGLGLEYGIKKYILKAYKEHKIVPQSDNLKELFYDLIYELHETQGNVVILIDEYDKPLLEYIEDYQAEKAKENQRIMKEFYSVLKDCEEYLHLTFITGVTKFAQVSIFSDLNHLEDITFDKRFATTLHNLSKRCKILS